MTSTAPCVAVVDDHPTVRLGVRAALEACLPGVRTVLTSTPNALLAAPRPPDVVVLDLQLGDGVDPAVTVGALVQQGARVLLHTQEPRPTLVARCLRAGAAGVVGKGEPVESLVAAVRAVARGERWLGGPFAAVLEPGERRRAPQLTPRELEAVRLYAGGLPLKSVARRMGVSEETAKEHLKRVRRKYLAAGRPARTKLDLLVRAVEDGHVPPVAAGHAVDRLADAAG
ncbi:response regulator [Cellulomonas marina]|uniref:DNA-binding response regulator, NarL/FixJ family, contains REC and HTH domains n=1 Tax=Cellulomonas marina TaxID=988821 RepID=A0A1I0ZKF2_9CELL|nr:response regulator transcription factor [Cellulomonas marina]SFB25957.1 DNA-binding response regulator, NarL/FixJ family, contains REC and HTH domains [Cellulomonas marina]